MNTAPPNILYKYRSLENNIVREIMAINNKSAYLSKPIDFDDPWDCFISPQNRELTEEAKKILSNLQIACFTTKDTNSRMWSHYANDHKGICIGYELGSNFTEAYNFVAVKYEDSIPSFDVSDFTSPESFEYLKVLLSTKSKIWDDQDEWRFISQNNNDRFLEFSKVHSVTFGIRCTEEHREKIMNHTSFSSGIEFREIFSDPSSIAPKSRNCSQQECNHEDAIPPDIEV